MTASLKVGFLLPEVDYEVKGDAINGKTLGPEHARLWTGAPLLHDYKVLLKGQSVNIARGKL